MDFNQDMEIVINNQFDYSNIVPEKEPVSYLIQYCEVVYNHFLELAESDEEKNEKLKMEFQNYEYKKSYETKFEVMIREVGSSFNNLSFPNYASFLEALKEGRIKDVTSLTIELNLTYRRGKSLNLSDYRNVFKIVFQPYNIVFTRDSNHNEQSMNQVENNINEILKSFKVQNTIFCTK